MFENSTTFLAVANVVNGLADGTGIVTELPAGSVGVFREIGDLLESSATVVADTGFFYVGWKDASGQIHKSPRFKGTKLSNQIDKDKGSLVNQVAHIGYNGTSGSMDEVASTYYSLRIVLNHTFGLLNNSPMMKTIPYKTASSTSQYAVAGGLAAAGAKVFARGVNKDVIFEVLVDEAGLAPDNTIDVVKGAKDITFDTAATYNTGTAVAVGDFIRLGVDGSTASTVADGVYKVTAVNSLVITLDRNVELATGTYAVTEADVILGSTGDAGEFGMKLTGNSVLDAKFNPITDRPFVVNFDVELGENFLVAEVTDTTGSFIGNGTYQLISALEARIQFEDRPRHIQAYPPTERRLEATSGLEYNVISVTITDDVFVDPTTGGNPKSPANIIIACLDSTVDADYGTISTVLGCTNIA